MRRSKSSRSFRFVSACVRRSRGGVCCCSQGSSYVCLVGGGSVSELCGVSLGRGIPLSVQATSGRGPGSLGVGSVVFSFIPSPRSMLLYCFVFKRGRGPCECILVGSGAGRAVVFGGFVGSVSSVLFTSGGAFYVGSRS